MEGRLNQDLSESLQAVFKKAMNFEHHILTKQTINTRRMNEVNKINVNQYDSDLEINEAHAQNTNYKGKNYDPNYQNKNKYSKNNTTNPSSSNSNTINGYNKYNNTGGNSNQNKNSFWDKPTSVHMTLTGLVNRDQPLKIQEVLQHPSQYSYTQMQDQQWVSTLS